MAKRKKKKSKKPPKQKKKLTAEQRRAKRERKKKYMTVFMNGKQKRVKRPPTIDGTTSSLRTTLIPSCFIKWACGNTSSLTCSIRRQDWRARIQAVRRLIPFRSE